MRGKAITFDWAMKQLQRQQCVRRACWADVTIATETMPPLKRRKAWHLFMQSQDFIGESYWMDGIINGWGGQVGGTPDRTVVIRDGMSYSPTVADRAADDWELLD